jgi:hypothetical protein
LSGGGGNYTLPVASDTRLGGVKIGSNINITDGVISVAAPFSGSYNDLSNKPFIPDSQVNADWNAVSGVSQILNKPTLFDGNYNHLTNKPNLFSGSYNDLTDKPFVPDAQIQSDWNQTNNTSLDYIKNKPTLFDGNYNHLTNKPSLFSGSYNDLTDKPILFSGSYADLTSKPTFATVATSGSYADLTNKPTIPAAQIQSDWNQVDTGSADYIKNKPSIPSAYVLPTASTTIKGGVKIDGTTIAINNGVISVGPSLTSATQFKGVWNASTNTPALSSNQAGAAAGWEYIVGTTGTRDLGNGTVTYNTGDIVIYDGTNWYDIPGNASTVSAFNGRTGIVTLSSSDVTTALGYTPGAQLKMTFSYGDLPSSPIGTVPAGAIIKEVSIILLASFDAASTLSVGTSTHPGELLATTDVITNATGTFTTEPAYKYTTNTDLVLSITAGASTQGNGIVVVYYE